jgi:iron complex outermembrane receptor protein/vitamin B12 transporter
VIVEMSGFATYRSEPMFAKGETIVNAVLQVGPIEDAIVVTASVSALPASQVGAPVTVLDSRTLDALARPEAVQVLRLVPGAQMAQTGGRGGAASLFVRGGASNFNKVLVDGVAVNDIGGAFDFAQMTTTGLDRIEVLRETNSVRYGSDALAGVVALTTRRGSTRVPEVTYAADGGNLGSFSTAAGIGGVVHRFDYYSEYAHARTANDVPNDEYRNGTYAGRFGLTLSGGTSISGTLRRTDASVGLPNGVSLYGIADDSSQKNALTYGTVAARSQITRRWQMEARFGSSAQTYRSVNPSPTGEPFDPFGFGANYLGQTATLRGANGYSVTGRAILDYGGGYPSAVESSATRRALSGETTVDVNGALAVSAGARYEREEGRSCFTGVGCLTAVPEPAAAVRNNGGGFVEGRLTVKHRTFVNAGLGLEHNAVFGEAVTPRVSVASYLRTASASAFGDTKLVFNAGTGIKAPSVMEEQSSLYTLLAGAPSPVTVDPLGPERSRSMDAGVEQTFARGAVRARVVYFRNRFHDLIEYVGKSALPALGVPPSIASAVSYGAYVNAQSYRAQGLESIVDASFAGLVRVSASYTHLAAEVTQAFSATPTFNPAFPGVAIGAYSPLVGQRPFRRAPNSGHLLIAYSQGRQEVALAASFVGTRDDSTFLSDPYFGNSMLLPNRGLDAAYQKLDLTASYRVHPRVRAYVSIENLLDRKYEAVFGYPALPITARGGAQVTFGGK